MRAQEDAAIAEPRNRGADNQFAKIGVVPANSSAVLGIIHIDDDVATAACPSGAVRNPSPPGGTAGRQRKCDGGQRRCLRHRFPGT